MKLRSYFLVLSALLLINSFTAANASDKLSQGLAIRYFQFTQADEPVGLVGLGYTLKINNISGSFELGGPLSDMDLEGKERIGDLEFFSNLTFGWEKTTAFKVGLRAEASIGRYLVNTSTFQNGIFTSKSETLLTLEPRIALVFNATDNIDFAIYGGMLVGGKSISEPIAGAALRLRLF